LQQPQRGGHDQHTPVTPPGAPVPPAPSQQGYGHPYTEGQGPARPAPRASSRAVLVTSGLAFVGITLIGLGYLLGGEARKFMLAGVQFIPLAVLAALAFAGLRNRSAEVFTYVWLAILALGTLFTVASSTVLGTLKDVDQFNEWVEHPGNVPVTSLFSEDAGWVVLLCLISIMLVSLISIAMLFKPVRVLVSRVIPIDPNNFVHKIALCYLTLVALSFFLPLLLLGGQPPLLLLMSSTTAQNLAVSPQDLVYQFVWTIPATFVAAGWPIVRTFKAMLARLGFVRPTLLQVVGAVVGGVVLAVVAALGLDPGINQLWRSMGWGTTDLEAFSRLMSQVITPLGAVLVGVTAGVGEELAVRGLLQPRIGLIASNLVFTSLHAFQYGVDALLSVFIIGLILGLIRKRTNTTTSAIVHGVYDFVLVMGSTTMFTGQ
jgi:hypothetical protein